MDMGLLNEQRLIGSSPVAHGARPQQYTPLKLTSKKYPNLGRGKPPASTFHTIEQLATLEGTLHMIMESVSSKSTDVSFFCREYWGSSASMAQLSLVEIAWGGELNCQVRRACILESLSLAVLSQMSSGTMRDVSVTVRLKLRKLIYNVHANCLALLDLMRNRWLAERKDRGPGAERLKGHCPHKLDFNILIEANRYCTLHDGEHVVALDKNSETITGILRTLCNGTSSPEASAEGTTEDILRAVSETLQGAVALESQQASAVRLSMLQVLRFEPMLKTDGSDADSKLPSQDPYERSGRQRFATDCAAIQFEPQPPMIADLDGDFFLPRHVSASSSDAYTLVLDIDETLVHSDRGNENSMGIRPGATQFLQRMAALGFELVTFTTATQDYADSVVDRIDPHRRIHHRLYRQHCLPWGPVYIKDLNRLGRDLNRTLIIDNIDDNFMLQPQNGILISDWIDDPEDQALYDLVPLLEDLVRTRAAVPDILSKYAEQIPIWAGMVKTQKGSMSAFKQNGHRSSVSEMQGGGRSGYQQGANSTSFGDIQNGSLSGYPNNGNSTMEQPVMEAHQQSATAPITATYVPVVVQMQPWGFVDATAAAAPAIIPAQTQVFQAVACAAPKPQENVMVKKRQGIKNRKLDASSRQIE